MRLSAITIAFASGLLFSTGVFADGVATPAAAPAPTAAPTTDAAPPATNEDDTVTCRYEATTGSNFKKRICHTQREWKQMSTDSHDLMDRLDDHSRLNGGLGGGN
jgi:invasion protein IalB